MMRVRLEDVKPNEKITRPYAFGCSSQIRGNLHSLFVDVDKCDRLGELIGFVSGIQRQEHLPTFYFVLSSPVGKWHLLAFTAKKWEEILSILEEFDDANLVEAEYVWQSRRKSYCVLRTSSKEGFVPEPKFRVSSEGKENLQKKNEYFTLLTLANSRNTWVTRFKKEKFSSELIIAMRDMFRGVNEKDPTFLHEEDDLAFKIFSTDKKQGYRRGAWVKERLEKDFKENIYFSVYSIK